MTQLNELEERARSLLQAAADTVDVGPGIEAVVRRRPVWPMIAAAAVVAGLVSARATGRVTGRALGPIVAFAVIDGATHRSGIPGYAGAR